MTDEELMTASELAAIRKHLKAAERELVKLRNRSGRHLTIFCESGSPVVIDSSRDGELDSPGERACSIDEGGSIVARMFISTFWDGGVGSAARR